MKAWGSRASDLWLRAKSLGRASEALGVTLKLSQRLRTSEACEAVLMALRLAARRGEGHKGGGGCLHGLKVLGCGVSGLQCVFGSPAGRLSCQGTPTQKYP